ncbi:MAG: hypothetical protein O2820_09345 [Planctomycetota bacterium]|nr:hypothetical protein [Planctomycetota bacterium]MDA1249417.1 hypothetical protein [Planctomycetota bacterium]
MSDLSLFSGCGLAGASFTRTDDISCEGEARPRRDWQVGRMVQAGSR